MKATRNKCDTTVIHSFTLVKMEVVLGRVIFHTTPLLKTALKFPNSRFRLSRVIIRNGNSDYVAVYCFSHDLTAAMLVSLKKKTGTILVSHTNPGNPTANYFF